MNEGQDLIQQLKRVVDEMTAAGRYEELLQIVSVPTLQRLNIEAAKARLSPLVITEDYRFILTAFDKEVDLAPINKALYMLFLNHPEGIEFKRLSEFKGELQTLYQKIGNRITPQTIADSIGRLVNPLDNSVNEKCARIKAAFAQCVDQYQLSYYAISSHTERHFDDSSKVWFERKKIITLPRHLVTIEK